MVPYVYLASVCWSLQCLISTLTQAGGGGLLFKFTGSVVVWGERGAADRYRWCVWVALTVFQPQWVCPHSWVCAFPIYTAQTPGCSIWSGHCVACGSSLQVFHKSTDSVGPAFCAFPSPSSSGSQGACQAYSLRVWCALSPPRFQPQFLRAPVGCMCLVSILGSWP